MYFNEGCETLSFLEAWSQLVLGEKVSFSVLAIELNHLQISCIRSVNQENVIMQL